MLGNKNTHTYYIYIYIHNFISPYSQMGRTPLQFRRYNLSYNMYIYTIL